MLHLITGQNGAGKSLRAIYLMYKRHGQGMEVYACGFRGLRAPFVKDFPDPRRWKELPANAVLFVDEAQKVWRTRTAGRAVPPEILDLETHRHQGIDIYLITQSPMYIDSHIRPLISSHEHLVSYDATSARVFRFTECYEDVKSTQLRNRGEFEIWKYPSEHFADYDSAEVHTAKAKVPWRQRIAKLMFVLAGLMILGCIGFFFWSPDAPTSAAVETRPKPSNTPALFGLGNGTGFSSEPVKRFDNAQDYMAEHTPRISQMPWSMPAMDGRAVQADPALYCMASGSGRDRTCSCITEQGTRWLLRQTDCEGIARWGPAYNPFKAPQEAGATRLASGVPASSGDAYAIAHNVYYVRASSRPIRSQPPAAPPACSTCVFWPFPDHCRHQGRKKACLAHTRPA